MALPGFYVLSYFLAEYTDFPKPCCHLEVTWQPGQPLGSLFYCKLNKQIVYNGKLFIIQLLIMTCFVIFYNAPTFRSHYGCIVPLKCNSAVPRCSSYELNILRYKIYLSAYYSLNSVLLMFLFQYLIFPHLYF